MADTNTNTVIMDGPQKYVASFVHTYVDTGESTPVKKIVFSYLMPLRLLLEYSLYHIEHYKPVSYTHLTLPTNREV